MGKEVTQFKKGNAGRKQGSKNKFTHFKDALYEVFERKGGVDGLETWASDPKNEKVFYEFMAKMLPKEVEVSGKDGSDLIIKVMNYKDKE